MRCLWALAAFPLFSFACTSSHDSGPKGDAGGDATVPLDASDDVDSGPSSALSHPCNLPGAIQFTANGPVTVPGGSTSWSNLSFLTLPAGFCAHYFGNVGNARQLRFAPGGELFVGSPTTSTTGGGANGAGAILVLPDDDLDGVADAPATFLGSLASTQGMLFANGYFYFQDDINIRRLPYANGQRTASGAPELVATLDVYTSTLHWPKTLDIADDGTIYVGNGGDQAEACDATRPFHGGVLSIAPGGGAPQQIAKGFRNPIAIRCARGKNHCFAIELAKDYSATQHGREKIVPIHQGDDWGFPCCATQGIPYSDAPAGTDCSGVTADTNSFLIGDTPFGLDFESGHWGGQWGGRAYVATHGAAGSWYGTRIVAIPMDPTSGLPQPSSDTDGNDDGMVDFATGWDDHSRAHGRVAAVVFSADGRLFVANDNNGDIFWIAAM
ncbi:MAG TPA: hypothetical protein VGI39_36060 [Polyangiaceae bacterium]|jgi:glucose/arabinose dehydrogenase